MKTIVYTGLAALAPLCNRRFLRLFPKREPRPIRFRFCRLATAHCTADGRQYPLRTGQNARRTPLAAQHRTRRFDAVGRPDRLVQRLFPRRTVVHVRIHRRRFLETAGRSLYRSPRKPANEPGYARYRLYDVLQLRQRGSVSRQTTATKRCCSKAPARSLRASIPPPVAFARGITGARTSRGSIRSSSTI